MDFNCLFQTLTNIEQYELHSETNDKELKRQSDQYRGKMCLCTRRLYFHVYDAVRTSIRNAENILSKITERHLIIVVVGST